MVGINSSYSDPIIFGVNLARIDWLDLLLGIEETRANHFLTNYQILLITMNR